MRATDGDAQKLERLGWGKGPSPYALALVDPIDDKDPVYVRKHPINWMNDHRNILPLVDMFQATNPKELDRTLYSELSSYEIECWLVMQSAHGREQMRRIKNNG